MTTFSDSGTAEGDARFSPIGSTMLWALAVFGGLVLMFLLTQWGLLDNVPESEVALGLAIGTNNAIGIVALGGWNAIGIVTIGGANSIGVISIGGLNSIGVVSFGGVNSMGVNALGGFTAFGGRGASIFGWAPSRIRNGSCFN